MYVCMICSFLVWSHEFTGIYALGHIVAENRVYQ